MISYEFTQYVPPKHNDSIAYAEELKVIKTFLETPSFPALKLSYPTDKKAVNAGVYLRKYFKQNRFSLKATQRDSDLYIKRITKADEKGE